VIERFRRRTRGVELSLAPVEVALLRQLVAQLDEYFADDAPVPGTDPVRDRLFPRAYLDPTEDASEADYQSVVYSDLAKERSETAHALVATLDAGTVRRDETLSVKLSVEDIERWIGALNDIRLALGVTLDIQEEMAPVGEDDPRAAEFAVYDWLTYLQGGLVEVLMGEEV
jgi:hypothetical protein